MMYRSERPDKGTIVYVGGLVDDVKKEDLEAEFEKFGKLNRVWVAFNPPGFAFVEYTKKEDAESAVSAMHDVDMFGSKLRVEISRGRGRGGRGGSSGRGGDRGSRGSFRGGRDLRSTLSGELGSRGQGLSRGRGGFGGRSSFDRDEDYKPFRGGGLAGRFDDFQDRRRPDFPEREFEGPRGFGASRDIGRDFGPRDEFGGRDYPPRDIDRGFGERGGRGYGAERELNGVRSYGSPRDLPPVERVGYPITRDLNAREYGIGQAGGGREFGAARDLAPVRDIGGARDMGAGREFDTREIGMRRDPGIRDFAAPRDLGNPRDFGGRPSRIDYANTDRFGAGGRGGFDDGEVRRAGNFDGARYSGGDIGGTVDYSGYGARDRFRSRSPIGRVSRLMY